MWGGDNEPPTLSFQSSCALRGGLWLLIWGGGWGGWGGNLNGCSPQVMRLEQIKEKGKKMGGGQHQAMRLVN